jgi:hypothetical protein
MWRYAAARTTGSSHLKRDEVCQDRFEVWSSDDVFLAAVSDGAGSAKRAEVGAEVAVRQALESMRAGHREATDWPSLVASAFDKARAAVLAQADSENLPARDFACTLLLVVLTREGGAAGQIGDGVIALRDDLGEGWSWLFWPQKGEYANMTRFLTDPEGVSPPDLAEIRQSVFEIALMTDGLEALALNYSERSAHDPFFEGVLAPLRSAEEVGEIQSLSTRLADFLASPRVSERTDDDLTLVIASWAVS